MPTGEATHPIIAIRHRMFELDGKYLILEEAREREEHLKNKGLITVFRREPDINGENCFAIYKRQRAYNKKKQ